jgi:hypothetical protein
MLRVCELWVICRGQSALSMWIEMVSPITLFYVLEGDVCSEGRGGCVERLVVVLVGVVVATSSSK